MAVKAVEEAAAMVAAGEIQVVVEGGQQWLQKTVDETEAAGAVGRGT